MKEEQKTPNEDKKVDKTTEVWPKRRENPRTVYLIRNSKPSPSSFDDYLDFIEILIIINSQNLIEARSGI